MKYDKIYCRRKSFTRTPGRPITPVLRTIPKHFRNGATLSVAAHIFGAALIAQTRSLEVEIVGLRGQERTNVLATLSIATAATERSVSEARVRRLHSRAPGEIALALQPFGRYRVGVESHLSANGPPWRVRYTIDPGPQMSVRTVEISIAGDGANDPNFVRTRTEFPLASGGPLSHALYEQGKLRIMTAASELGYLDGRFTRRELRVDRELNVADVILHYDTGTRYRFGSITFFQNVVDSTLLAGFVQFQRGDPFDTRQLLNLQANLGASPYFSRVEVVPRRDLADGIEVPIEVHLTPRPSQRFQIGAGFGTNSGARGTAEAEFRRLNRAGHRAELEVGASPIERNVSARYVIPLAFPRTEVFTITTAYLNRTLATSNSEAVLARVSVARRRGVWQETLGLTYQQESFEVGTDSGTTSLLFPGVSWTFARADDRIFPTRGHRLRFELQGGSDAVGSDVSFVRARATARLIRPLSQRTRFLTRLEGGATSSSSFRRLPPSIRFFAGGDQSVRGYEYQSLGPGDALGNVVGGEFLITGSIELEQRLLERWGIAAFLDFGNALSAFELSLEQGVGGGLRWLSPVGMVRLDLAAAVSQPGTPLRLHLVVGPDL